MTPTALKAMIELTQDGAKFDHIYGGASVIGRCPLIVYVEQAIESAEDISDLSEKLDYAVTMLNRAREIVAGLDLDEKIEEDQTQGLAAGESRADKPIRFRVR